MNDQTINQGSNILDDLFDQSMNDIADLPTYDVPPKGFYRLLITKAEQKIVKIKDDRDAPVLDIGYKVKEAIQLSDESKRATLNVNENGEVMQEFNETFFFHTDPEKTKSAIKTAFKGVAEKLNLSTLKQVVEALPGLEVYATVDHRVDKNDKEKVYAKVQNVKVV